MSVAKTAILAGSIVAALGSAAFAQATVGTPNGSLGATAPATPAAAAPVARKPDAPRRIGRRSDRAWRQGVPILANAPDSARINGIGEVIGPAEVSSQLPDGSVQRRKP